MNDPHSTRILSGGAAAVPQRPQEAEEWFRGDSHTGRVRSNNEDRFFCDEERGLFIVADGMGGHAAGEEASRIAIDVLSEALSLEVVSRSGIQETLIEVLCGVNREVIQQSESNFHWRGMGSTAVIAIVQEATLYLAHVGDSRAYVLRGGRLHQLSQDHSVAAVLAKQHHIKQEEVRTHALRNRLTMCLGVEEQVEPETLRLDLEQGDCVLLCSDGLWDMLPDEEIAHLLQLYPAPQEAVKALIQAANEAGGKDNITAVVIHPRLPVPDDADSLKARGFTAAPDTMEDTVILRNNANA